MTSEQIATLCLAHSHATVHARETDKLDVATALQLTNVQFLGEIAYQLAVANERESVKSITAHQWNAMQAAVRDLKETARIQAEAIAELHQKVKDSGLYSI